ncbi:unnamed protein product [Mytilus coruscus]|uniref:ZMYM2-like/QRICH1 C-terminal domain-containing protein n=1 Tax=Mytilus coruscus TaxID=42192 RepID=A0A6J8BJA9_MYTCO|nr:unnamed protein product [Mytilus coruscus]
MADLNTCTFDNTDPNDDINSQNEVFLLMPLVLPNFNLETSLLEGLEEDETAENQEKPTDCQRQIAQLIKISLLVLSTQMPWKWKIWLQLMFLVVVPLIDPESDVDLMDAVNIIESQKENNDGLQSRFAELDEEEMELILDDVNSKGTKKKKDKIWSQNIQTSKYHHLLPFTVPSITEGDLEKLRFSNMLSLENPRSLQRKVWFDIMLSVANSREWLADRNKDVNFENFSTEMLNTSLREFYTQVRSTNGNFYSKSTFFGIRASISRHLRSPPYNRPESLMADKSLYTSNQMFTAMLRKLEREGLDRTKHHPSIAEGDLEKLRNSNVLSLENPKSLQRKVWFDIMLSFGRRGRENQRKFSDNTFALQKDSRGIEYVEFQMSETTKNHKGDQTDDDFERNPRMYATGNDNCPIKSFQKYMSKRCTSSTHFFQQPRAKVNKDDIAWYTSRPVGEKMLNYMMKQISTEAKLSKIYTNHCVRATTVTVLSHVGVSNREIMKITGHKCESSLDSYNADSSEAQKRKYSGILQGKSPRNQTATPNAVEMSQNPVSALPAPLQAPPCPPSVPYNMNMLQIVCLNNTNINTRMSVPTYSKQFEINHSSVQIFNYHVPQQ